MLELTGSTTVYLACRVTDLRKNYHGLAAIIKLKFQLAGGTVSGASETVPSYRGYIFEWLHLMEDLVERSSLIGDAILYTLNQETYLRCYLTMGI